MAAEQYQKGTAGGEGGGNNNMTSENDLELHMNFQKQIHGLLHCMKKAYKY